MNVTEKIKIYFQENPSVLADCIEELDSYNGCLGDDRWISMEEFNLMLNHDEPLEIATRAFYGYDADNGIGSSFNPNRDYFRFNGYGNFISSNYREYYDFLDDYVIQEMLENRNQIPSMDADDELAQLFDELEEEEEEEE